MPSPPPGRTSFRRVPGSIRLLLLAEAILAALYVLDAVLGHPQPSLTRLVDLGAEANLPTWFSSAQLLVLGLLIGTFALAEGGPPRRRRWPILALSALFVAMSLDEVAQIHERFGKWTDFLLPGGTREGSAFSNTGIWMFLVAPPLLAYVGLLWRAVAPDLRDHPGIARLYVLGFLVYMVSAFGLEALANLLTPATEAWMVEVLCEEIGEMVGVTLMIWATLELLSSNDIRLRAG